MTIKRKVTNIQYVPKPSMGGLTDVDDTGITDGQALLYNATTEQYEPGTPGSLADGTTAGNMLRWSGTAWVENSSINFNPSAQGFFKSASQPRPTCCTKFKRGFDQKFTI